MSPIYTYRCPQCEEEFDKLVLMSDMDKYQPCPNRVVDPDPINNKGILRVHKIVPCGAPSKRQEVPSSPAAFIMR